MAPSRYPPVSTTGGKELRRRVKTHRHFIFCKYEPCIHLILPRYYASTKSKFLFALTLKTDFYWSTSWKLYLNTNQKKNNCQYRNNRLYKLIFDLKQGLKNFVYHNIVVQFFFGLFIKWIRNVYFHFINRNKLITETDADGCGLIIISAVLSWISL